jgi:hypothetical protein
MAADVDTQVISGVEQAAAATAPARDSPERRPGAAFELMRDQLITFQRRAGYSTW